MYGDGKGVGSNRIGNHYYRLHVPSDGTFVTWASHLLLGLADLGTNWLVASIGRVGGAGQLALAEVLLHGAGTHGN